MKATIKDVARVANVSVATASMAVNNSPKVKASTRERILEAAKRLNYTPNTNARNLINQRSQTIGLVVTDITNPFFGELVNEINYEVLSRGYSLLLGVSNDNIQNEAAGIKKFKENRVEGVIVVPSVQEKYDLEHLYDLKSNGIPFVFSTTSYSGINADCVMCDLKKGSYLLTRHLLKKGHKKIYLFSGSKKMLFSSHRIEGYQAAFEEMGVDRSEDWIKEIFPSYDSAYAMTETLLKSVRPDAIITVNDVMAMGVLKCLKDNGMKVPGDISVAGYDDLLYASLLETPLTTVRQPVKEIARKSVEVLLDKIENGTETYETYYIDPVLKIRETTK